MVIGLLGWKESYRKQSLISKGRITANMWKEWEKPQMSHNTHVISVSVEILKTFTYRMQFTTNTARSDLLGLVERFKCNNCGIIRGYKTCCMLARFMPLDLVIRQGVSRSCNSSGEWCSSVEEEATWHEHASMLYWDRFPVLSTLGFFVSVCLTSTWTSSITTYIEYGLTNLFFVLNYFSSLRFRS
jgi:hypothetical protein